MNKLEARDGFAEMLRDLEDYAGIPARQVARMMEVNEKTVRNWLDGYSQPYPSQMFKLFRLLNIPMIPFLRDRGEIAAGMDETERHRQSIINWVLSIETPDDLKNLDYMLSGVHGSASSSVLVEIACNMSCTMHHRHQVADLVYTNYIYDKTHGNNLNEVSEDGVDRFKEAIRLGRDAALNGEDSYNQSW